MVVNRFSGFTKPAPKTETGADSNLVELDSVRDENLRLQRELTKALEERNRLLRKLNLGAATTRPSGSRVLEERLEEVRDEVARLKQEKQVVEQKYQFTEEQLARLEQVPVEFVRRLEELGNLQVGEGEPASEPLNLPETGMEQVIDRFNRAVEAVWRKLDTEGVFENQALKREVGQLNSSLDTGRDKQARLSGEVARYRTNLDAMEQKVQRTEAERSIMAGEIERLRTRLVDAKQEQQRLEDDNFKLKGQLRVLRGLVDDELFEGVTGGGSGAGFGSGIRTWLQTRQTYAGLAVGLVLASLGYWGLERYLAPLTTVPEGWPAHVNNQLPAPAGPPVPAGRGQADLPTAQTRQAGPLPRIGTVAGRPAGLAGGPGLVRLDGASFRMGTDLYGTPDIEQIGRAHV
jgi:hypothetical protein